MVRVATRHNIEELAWAYVDDLSRPALHAPSANSAEHRLIQLERIHVSDASRVVDQRQPEVHDGVHDRVPITGQVPDDLGHRTAVTANEDSGPPTGTISDRGAWRRDPLVDLTPRADLTVQVRALPSLLGQQSRSTTEHPQVDQHSVHAAVGVNTATTTGAHRPRTALSIRDSHLPRPVFDSVDVHVGQADKQFAHARRISFQHGLPDTEVVEQLQRWRDPCIHRRPSPHAHSPFQREEPLIGPLRIVFVR